MPWCFLHTPLSYEDALNLRYASHSNKMSDLMSANNTGVFWWFRVWQLTHNSLHAIEFNANCQRGQKSCECKLWIGRKAFLLGNVSVRKKPTWIFFNEYDVNKHSHCQSAMKAVWSLEVRHGEWWGVPGDSARQGLAARAHPTVPPHPGAAQPAATPALGISHFPGDGDRLRGTGTWAHGWALLGGVHGRAGQGCGKLKTSPAAAPLRQGLTAVVG